MSLTENSYEIRDSFNKSTNKWYQFWKLFDVNIKYVLIASGFSWLFVNFFIDRLGIDFWQDIRAYESNFRDIYYYYQALQAGPIEFFTKEILWLYIVDWLLGFNITTTQALYVISLVSCSIISYFLLINTKRIYSVLFLINPIFIDFVIGQGRSSFATAIFFGALSVRSELLRLSLIVAASAIHFSTPLFAGFYYFYTFARKINLFQNLGYNKRTWFLLALSIAFVFEFLRTFILVALNDRRAETQLDQDPSLMLAFGFILFILTYAVTARSRNASFAYFFYSVNALLFAFATFNGVYASRYVAVGYTMLCIMQSQQGRIGKVLFGTHMLAFSAVYLRFWLA